MSPRYFAKYAKEQPQEYKAFSDSMWNGFVSITKHVPIVNRFFSFTPDFLEVTIDYEGQGEDLDMGAARGFSQGIPVELFDHNKPL